LHLRPKAPVRIAPPRGAADDVDGVPRGLARGRLEEPDQHADGGAFAGAVAAEKGEDRARLHGDGEVVDRREVAEALGEAARLDDRRAHACAPASPSSVVSMSAGTCSTNRTVPRLSAARSAITRSVSGDWSRRTSTRAHGPVARAPATYARSRAAAAMARASSPQAR